MEKEEFEFELAKKQTEILLLIAKELCNIRQLLARHLEWRASPSREAIELVLEKNDLGNFKADVIRDIESIATSGAVSGKIRVHDISRAEWDEIAKEWAEAEERYRQRSTQEGDNGEEEGKSSTRSR